MQQNLKPLFEMAQINLKEMNPNGFPYNQYKIEVYGEGGKLPHLHIIHIQRKWGLRFDFAGNFLSVKDEGDGNYNTNDLEKRLCRWFKHKNKQQPAITNLETVKLIWTSMNFYFQQ